MNSSNINVDDENTDDNACHDNNEHDANDIDDTGDMSLPLTAVMIIVLLLLLLPLPLPLLLPLPPPPPLLALLVQRSSPKRSSKVLSTHALNCPAKAIAPPVRTAHSRIGMYQV